MSIYQNIPLKIEQHFLFHFYDNCSPENCVDFTK